MKKNLEKCGWKVLSTWAMGDDLEVLSHALEAEVNLVVSSVGLRTAKISEKEYKMPYVVGTPVGTFTEEIVQALEKKERYPYKRLREENSDKEQPGSGKNDKEVMLIGEPVTTESLALAIEQKYGIPVHVLCPLQETEDLLFRTSRQVLGEEDMEEAFKRCRYHSSRSNVPSGSVRKNVSSTNFHIWHFPEEFTRKSWKKSKISGSIKINDNCSAFYEPSYVIARAYQNGGF